MRALPRQMQTTFQPLLLSATWTTEAQNKVLQTQSTSPPSRCGFLYSSRSIWQIFLPDVSACQVFLAISRNTIVCYGSSLVTWFPVFWYLPFLCSGFLPAFWIFLMLIIRWLLYTRHCFSSILVSLLIEASFASMLCVCSKLQVALDLD